MVVDVDPVANLFASAIELWCEVTENISNLARDKLLDVLVRAVVIGAV